MNPSDRFNGPFSHFRSASAWPERLRRHSPGLVWLRKHAAAMQQHTALPSDLYLLTVYCDRGLQCGTADEERDLEVVVSALRSRPVEFRSSGGGELAVALLTPLGLLQALRAPMEGITDRRLPLAYFCGWREQHALRESLMRCPSPQQRLERLAGWLESRIADTPEIRGPERRVALAALALSESIGDPPSLEQIASELAIGRRQLERDFRRWLGVSPGSYARLLRFQRAAAAAQAGQDLMHVAADQGYADQPHMTRTFRQMACSTPGEIAAWSRQADASRLRAAFAGRTLMLHASHAAASGASATETEACEPLAEAA